MALILPARTTRVVRCAEIISISFNDTAADAVSGQVKTFGSNSADQLVFDAINMPMNAHIIGGDILLTASWTGTTTSTLSIGVAGSTAALLAAFNLKGTTDRTALLLTSTYAAIGGANIRFTFAHTGTNALTGQFALRLLYVIRGSAEHVVPH